MATNCMHPTARFDATSLYYCSSELGGVELRRIASSHKVYGLLRCRHFLLHRATSKLYDSDRKSRRVYIPVVTRNDKGLVASCRVVSCRVVSCRVVSCRVVSCRVVSCRVVSCRVVSCRVVSCRVVSCRVVSCRGYRDLFTARCFVESAELIVVASTIVYNIA